MADETNPATGALVTEHAECIFCFEELHKEPTGVLTHQGSRTCQHFFHRRCLDSWRASGKAGQCPFCRCPCDGFLTIPSIRCEPRAWFQAVDLNKDGKLDQAEVLQVLAAALPINHRHLEANQSHLWSKWDADGNGSIEYEELFAPNGLIAWIERHFPRDTKGGQAPDIRVNKDAWFQYWDEDKGGTLSIVEVTRALIKSFGLSQDNHQVMSMQSIVTNIWPIFDLDGSGEIDRAEFSCADGLADTIIASYGH